MRLTSLHKSFVLFPRLLPPVHVGELPQRILDLGIIQAQGNEAAPGVGGVAEEGGVAFEGYPVGGKSIGRHHQHQRPGLFQALLDLEADQVARLDDSLVEPHAEAIRLQPFGQFTHGGFVFGTLAEKYVIFESNFHLLRDSLVRRPLSEIAQISSCKKIKGCPP